MFRALRFSHYADYVQCPAEGCDRTRVYWVKPLTAADALDALKLSVGFAASRGSSWKELNAADMNHDGRVTAADALEILKTSVGVNTIQPSWVFVPNDSGINPDLGTMTRTTVTYKHDLNLSAITAPTSVTITGILVWDVMQLAQAALAGESTGTIAPEQLKKAA